MCRYFLRHHHHQGVSWLAQQLVLDGRENCSLEQRYCSNLAGWDCTEFYSVLTSTHYRGHEDVMHNSLCQSKVDTAVVEINLNTVPVKLQTEFDHKYAYLIIATCAIHLLKIYLGISSESGFKNE